MLKRINEGKRILEKPKMTKGKFQIQELRDQDYGCEL